MSLGILVDVGRSNTSFENDFISIDLDVMNDEAHEWTNDVTSNPVEVGAPITDHIQEMPDKLKITGMISDSSISDDVVYYYSSIDESEFLTRAQTAFDFLYDILKDRLLITVYTKYKVYPDMALVSLNLPRNNKTGDAINFTAEFMRVRIVSTQYVDMPKGISPKKTAKADKKVQQKTETAIKSGEKATVPVPATPKLQSSLKSIGL